MKSVINTPLAPSPIGPYSQAVKVGNLLFCSGQIAIDPISGQLDAATIVHETHRVMKNIAAVLSAADTDFSGVVKTSIFLSDMDLFSEVNEVYGSYFESEYPARETVAVKTLPKNVNVEISVTACLD